MISRSRLKLATVASGRGGDAPFRQRLLGIASRVLLKGGKVFAELFSEGVLRLFIRPEHVNLSELSQLLGGKLQRLSADRLNPPRTGKPDFTRGTL